MPPSALPVLVAGAGPSGLVAALTLLQNDVPVRIIDKAPNYPIAQRGHGLWPRTFEVFHFLGVQEIEQRAWAVPLLREYKLGTLKAIKTFVSTPYCDPTPSIPYNNPKFLGQPVVEAILRSHLEKYGCSVEMETELVSFVDDGKRVIAEIVKSIDGQEITETFEASFLVGTDGAKGVTRKQLGLTFLGETKEDLGVIVGDFCMQVEGIDRQHWHFFGDQSSDLLNFRPTDIIADDGFQVIMTLKDGDAKQLAADEKLLLERMSKLIGREIDVRKVVYLSSFRPNIRMVNRFSLGRVFVAGDAAHVHSPTGGQGLNTSVQDAFNLAWKLALVHKGFSPVTLLDSYNAERLPVVAEMLNLTTQALERVTKLSTVEAGMQREEQMKMLGVNYRTSPVVLDEYTVCREEEPIRAYGILEKGVLVAGDRAPDAPGLEYVGESEGKTKLFDVFGTYYHTVLIFTPDVVGSTTDILTALAKYTVTTTGGGKPLVRPLIVLPPGTVGPKERMENAAAVVLDSDGHAHRAYLVTEGEIKIVVVRPDGVVGAIVHGPEGVGRYFSNIFV